MKQLVQFLAQVVWNSQRQPEGFHALLGHPQQHAPDARPLAFFVIDAVNQTVRQLDHAGVRTAHGVDLHRAVPGLALVGSPVQRRGGHPMGQEDEAAAVP